MGKITLVGKHQGRIGYTFLYAGTTPECKKCKFSRLCHTLKEGWYYRVVKVRNVSHKCPIHEEGAVVVEVEELPLHFTISKKEAVEGAIITVKKMDCRNKLTPGTDKWLVCCNPYIKETKVKILRILGPVDCGTDEDLVEVVLERVD